MDSVGVSVSAKDKAKSQSTTPVDKARARALVSLASECPGHHVACYRSVVTSPHGGVAVIVDPVPGAPLGAPKSEAQFRRWARQLMRAIRYLHSRGITHGHIGPDSIVVDGDRLTLVGLEKQHKAGTDKRRSKARDYADGARSLLSEAASEVASRTTGLLGQIAAEAEALDLGGVEAIVAAL